MNNSNEIELSPATLSTIESAEGSYIRNENSIIIKRTKKGVDTYFKIILLGKTKLTIDKNLPQNHIVEIVKN